MRSTLHNRVYQKKEIHRLRRFILRLLTWNIGYAEDEDDTRAHGIDLPAVAELILRQDADAVALQN